MEYKYLKCQILLGYRLQVLEERSSTEEEISTSEPTTESSTCSVSAIYRCGLNFGVEGGNTKVLAHVLNVDHVV
jgi:hypothetical protein